MVRCELCEKPDLVASVDVDTSVYVHKNTLLDFCFTVPIIVAINKIDKSNADVVSVK
jgi:hypothetical protein